MSVPPLSNVLLVKLLNMGEESPDEDEFIAHKGFQVNLNDIHKQRKLKQKAVQLKEFEGFMEYKKVKPPCKFKRRHPLKPIASSHATQLTKQHEPFPGSGLCSVMVASPSKRAKDQLTPAEEYGQKLPTISRHYENPTISMSRAEPSHCERCNSLPRILPDKSSPSHAKSKFHHKYSLEKLRKYSVMEPRVTNVYAGCMSPERIYQKAEYLSALPINPNFDIAKLDSRIQRLCQHARSNSNQHSLSP